MTTTETGPSTTTAGYQLVGSLLEVCSCETLCPCWIGEDPDQGTCDSVIAYQISQGRIRGVQVDGLTLVNVCQIPGNVLEGNWRVIVFVDDRASDEQMEALLDAFTASWAARWPTWPGWWGRSSRSRRAPVEHSIVDGTGKLTVGDMVDCSMQPYRGPDGSITTLNNSIFSTVPGSPAYVSKSDHQKIDIPEHGYQWELEGKNAIQSDWKIDFAG